MFLLFLCLILLNNHSAVSYTLHTNPTNQSANGRFISTSAVSTTFGVLNKVWGYFQSGISAIFERTDFWVGQNRKHKKITYGDYHVLRAMPRTEDEVELLQDLTSEVDGVDFWTTPAKNSQIDILVEPGSVEDVKEYFEDNKLAYEVIVKDLQNIIAYENPKMTRDQKEILVGRKGHPMTWLRYHRYSDMIRYMEFLVYTYPDLVELITIGYSSDGQPLKVVKVSSDNFQRNGISSTKPSLWIDGGMHGREWITSAVVMYIIKQLVERYETNSDLVDGAVWYLMPVANPDGYEYSHLTDRLWKKTRSKPTGQTLASKLFSGDCIGVDLNSNFASQWGREGSSADPCSQRYAGEKAFSEPESMSIANFIMSRKKEISMFLTFHSYSQSWLLPWSYSQHRSPDVENMIDMAKTAVEAILKASGMEYSIGPSSDNSRPTSGASDDWAKQVAGVTYAYTVELRDRGSYGFLLPATQILPTAKETFAAVKAAALKILDMEEHLDE